MGVLFPQAVGDVIIARMSPSAKALVETMSAAGCKVGIQFDDDQNAIVTTVDADDHKHLVRAETIDDAMTQLAVSMGWEDLL